MRKPSLLLGLITVLGGCATRPPLWPSRVPYAPLVEKLQAAGGKPAKAIRVQGAEDLYDLKPSRRYKYVVRENGLLVVAPRPADEAGNEYVHPVLGLGEPVRTAGYLHVEHRGAGADDTLVFVDQDSKAYCPSFASLEWARVALARVNVRREQVRFEDHPPDCAAAMR